MFEGKPEFLPGFRIRCICGDIFKRKSYEFTKHVLLECKDMWKLDNR